MRTLEIFRRTMKFKKMTLGNHKAISCRFGSVSVESFSFTDIEQALESSYVFPTFHNLTLINSEDDFNIELTYNILN